MVFWTVPESVVAVAAAKMKGEHKAKMKAVVHILENEELGKFFFFNLVEI